MDKWKQHSRKEVLIGSSFNFSEFDITNTKFDELNKWKKHKVYDKVDKCNEKFIDLRQYLGDSPTSSKESIHLILNTFP